MNDDLPRPAPNRIWTRALGATALLGAAVLAVSSSASAFGFGGHFGGGAMRLMPGATAKFHPRTHAWPTRGPDGPRDGGPRQRHWPSIPSTPRDARVVQDRPPPPVTHPACPANSHAAFSTSRGWYCACNPGFVFGVRTCVVPGTGFCPPHSHPGGPHDGCICDTGYVDDTGPYCVLQPPPCGLPQCPSSDGGGPGSAGDVPQKPERAQ